MKTYKGVVALCLLLAGGGAAYGIYQFGVSTGQERAGANTLQQRGTDQQSERRVLYWHDPMVPGQRFDRPGKSPFMDMDLVPVYDEAGTDGGVTIDPRIRQNLGIRTVPVVSGAIETKFTAVGSVAFDERALAVVSARADGYIERLHVRAELDHVAAGQPLVDLYVPAWLAAQEEYLSLLRMQSTDLASALLDAARQRMQLAGMTSAQIALVEASGAVQPRMTIPAPIGGVIRELLVREGGTVMTGAPLFRINALANVWINAQVPERLAAQIQPGQVVEVGVPSLPGVAFHGKVDVLLPQVSPTTRTTTARIELANPEGRLVPGMFATVQFSPSARASALLVPTEAVIRTGRRTVIMVLEGEGRFRSADVEIGLERDGLTEVVKGLSPGERVVVSGQFLVDSEASLKATEDRLGPETGR